MGDHSLAATSALSGVNLKFATCTLTERTDIALVSVAVPQNRADALSEKLKKEWDLDIPAATATNSGKKMRAIPLTADQFMLAFSSDPDLSEVSVQESLSQTAYTTLQSDGWVVLELSGQGSVNALERICPIDLDPSAFPVGASARTMMEHIGACIIRIETEKFWLLSARSTAQSFLHAVETSCRWSEA